MRAGHAREPAGPHELLVGAPLGRGPRGLGGHDAKHGRGVALRAWGVGHAVPHRRGLQAHRHHEPLHAGRGALRGGDGPGAERPAAAHHGRGRDGPRRGLPGVDRQRHGSPRHPHGLLEGNAVLAPPPPREHRAALGGVRAAGAHRREDPERGEHVGRPDEAAERGAAHAAQPGNGH